MTDGADPGGARSRAARNRDRPRRSWRGVVIDVGTDLSRRLADQPQPRRLPHRKRDFRVWTLG